MTAPPPPGVAILSRSGRVRRLDAALRQMAGPGVAPGRPVLGLFAEPDAAWAVIAPVLRGQRRAGQFEAALRTGGPVSVLINAAPPAGGRRGEAVLQVIAPPPRLQALAHDVNNLFAVILAAGRDAPGDPAALRQIHSSAESGAALMRRCFTPGPPPPPPPLAVDAALQAIAPSLRLTLGPGITLDLTLAAGTAQVRLEPAQLERVLLNLAANARLAMPEGGRFSVRTSLLTLDHALTSGRDSIGAGRTVLVELEDTGTGITAAALPHIFEPFFSTRRDRGGTGLGLATVHGIVQQAGGLITADSVVGQGTRFRLYVPCCAPPAPAGRLVLVVEDEARLRRMTAQALRRAGWSVLEAPSADDALALLTADPACGRRLCAVVSDVAMPGLDGPGLLTALRARHLALPAILTSGYARLPGLPEGVKLLTKPYATQTLLDSVAACALPVNTAF